MRPEAVSIAFALVINGALAHARRAGPLTHHVGIVPAEGGHPLVMALGDELQLVAHRYRCHYDVCTIEDSKQTPRWAVESSGLSISTTGAVRARRPGGFAVRVRLGSRTGRDSVRVLPPVKDLGWTTRPARVSVGDTLRIAVLARDSSGRVVGRLTLQGHSRGTGRSGEVLTYDDHGYTVLLVDQPGLVELVGRLAHRTDTLRIEALARSP